MASVTLSVKKKSAHAHAEDRRTHQQRPTQRIRDAGSHGRPARRFASADHRSAAAGVARYYLHFPMFVRATVHFRECVRG